ncbi:MAG: GGDEF domain-containing protein [Desulfobacteraceae bacterium]|jgi:diguanylate cyclase (GGDEF)-like protein
MNETVQKLLKLETDLPSPPAIAVRVLEEIKKEECSLEGLARIIESDPALVTKILRIANSSHYGLVAEVNTLPRALSVLGLNAVKNVVLSFVLVDTIRGEKKSAFNYDLFWRRSVTTAVSADLVCKLIGQPCDDIFLTALLQDIGAVFMYICHRDDYLAVLERTRFMPSSRADIETDIFSFNHQDVGSAMLKEWGLPREIYSPIGYHHAPHKAPSEWQFVSKILNIAHNLSSIYHGNHSAEAIEDTMAVFTGQFGLKAEDVDALIDRIANHTVELLSFFEIPAGDMKPFSQILQDANAELGKLNLTYEQLVLQYQNAKEAAESMARELREANRKLRRLATTDGLTGLYNHRAFQDILHRRVSEANRHGRSLSMMMLDLDHFKSVNDKHGHPVGDAVLKAISTRITAMLRSEDIFARYGGEEFAVILPETTIKGAIQLAERIRMAIADLVVKINGASLNVTVSAGISANHPGQGDCDKAALIEAADRALYMAKNAGRNVVRVCLLNQMNAQDSTRVSAF